MAAHAVLSASGSKKWMSCPASIRLESNYPTEKSSSFAALGTGAHALAEYCLTNSIIDVDSQFAKIFEGIKVDQEMVEAVQQYIDYVNLEAEGAEEFLIEQRVSLSRIRESMFGTADAIVIKDGVCNVIDLKYGAGVRVSAFENTQGLYYAAGVSMAYGKRYDIHTYKITIVQPRMDNISEYEVSAGKLQQWVENILKPAVKATEDPDAPLNPTVDGCRWCKAKPDCHALAEFSYGKAVEGFDTILPEPKMKQPDFITSKQLSIIYSNLPLMKMFIKTIEDKVLLDLQSGKTVEGYTLVEGRSTRAWKNPAAFERKMKLRKFRVADIYQPRKLISPSQAENLLGKNHKLLEGQIYKPIGKPTVGHNNLTVAPTTPENDPLSGFIFKKQED
tara:strand:- start:1154 stop:2323 length:1170 start_codon:yes stop_codon:yes gene_type:complete